MTLKILKQLVKRGGLKGIILSVLVSLAVGYIKKKFSGTSLDPETLQDKLCNYSSDWRDIFDNLDSSEKNALLNEILRRL